MDIHPLNGILQNIDRGDAWGNRRSLSRLIAQWNQIVGPSVAQHTCPLEVHNRTLQVATSTAVWAQNLSFERRRILKKLNQNAAFQPLELKEIRFSTAGWHNRPGSDGAVAISKRLHSYEQEQYWQQHPSRLPPSQTPQLHLPVQPAATAVEAFERWSNQCQQQVKQVPLCPQCQTPTPTGELQRWSVCAFCMTHHWQAAKNATQPNVSGMQTQETDVAPQSPVTLQSPVIPQSPAASRRSPVKPLKNSKTYNKTPSPPKNTKKPPKLRKSRTAPTQQHQSSSRHQR